MIAARKITARQAHVENEQNLLVRGVRKLDRHASYSATVVIPTGWALGEALVEAGQQIVRGICHVFEGIPDDHGVAIHRADLLHLAGDSGEGNVEASVRLEIDRDNPRNILWHCDTEIDFHRDGARLAHAIIKSMTLPRTVGERMMRRNHVRLRAIAA